MLDAKNIHKSFVQEEHKLHVLKGIDLKINEEDVLSIIGPSGAGKSTLLHVMGGLDKPDEGSVVLDGEDLQKLSDQERANVRNQKIGFVFQFYHLLPEFSALENVLVPALIQKDLYSSDPLKNRALALLDQFGLADRASHKPKQLSGGEQQRVAIARALINQPKIVFCDEPTGNLDSETGKEIVELLMKLNKDNNQTLVIVTHDENIASSSNRIIHLKDGMLI